MAVTRIARWALAAPFPAWEARRALLTRAIPLDPVNMSLAAIAHGAGNSESTAFTQERAGPTSAGSSTSTAGVKRLITGRRTSLLPCAYFGVSLASIDHIYPTLRGGNFGLISPAPPEQPRKMGACHG